MNNAEFPFKCQILPFIENEMIMFRYFMDNTKEVEGLFTNNTAMGFLLGGTTLTKIKNITLMRQTGYVNEIRFLYDNKEIF